MICELSLSRKTRESYPIRPMAGADPVTEAFVLSDLRVSAQTCELLRVIADRAPFLPCCLDSPDGSCGAPETGLSSD